MTIDLPPTAQQASPGMFGLRAYVLPDAVNTNLPRGHAAEPAGEHRARGLLVELCRQWPATPVALYHRPLRTPIGNPDGVVVTAIARDRRDRILTVVWRHQHHPRRPGQHRGWLLTVNGITPPRGSGTVPPAPAWLARIATSVIED